MSSVLVPDTLSARVTAKNWFSAGVPEREFLEPLDGEECFGVGGAVAAASRVCRNADNLTPRPLTAAVSDKTSPHV